MDSKRVNTTTRTMDSTRGVVEIDIKGLFFRLLEKIGYIILTAIIGAFITGIYAFLIAIPKYEATSAIYVLSSSSSAINISDLQLGSYLASDYMAVFDTWEVHEKVRQNLNLPYKRDDMMDMVSVTNRSDTRIIYITVTSANPMEAVEMANEYAKVAGQYISDIMITDEPSMFSEAIVPEKPVSPRKKLLVFAGGLIGALITAFIITIQFISDDKIKTVEDVRRYTNKTVLAIIPAHYGRIPSNKTKRYKRN